MSRLLFLTAGLALVAAALTTSSLDKHIGTLVLGNSFNPVKEAYWTGYPHHRRTPFAVSPDGETAFLAYLDSSGTGVHIQGVDPRTFAAVGTSVTVKAGKEAGGLVAHNDGFALLTNEVVFGESEDPLPVIYKYTNGKQAFRTLLGGSGFPGDALASPDINGDLVFSEKAGYYAAYIVVTSYSGSASGHFGDAIRYVTPDGVVKEIQGASSSWGCSHNTGIALEEADEPPFASICAEDQGAIWLNTETQGMTSNGIKVSNEHTINGASNEAMGGTSGSYSSLARFIGSDSYIFSWVSRGAINVTPNDWMGEGYTHVGNRTSNRNVAIALFSDKKTLIGEQATSKVGAVDGDSQINWITDGSNDCSNAHAAAFDATDALVTWEEISNPTCDFEAMGCKGKFAGTKFQVVDRKGEKIGKPISSEDIYVSGDMVTFSDGRICWPYVNMDWSLDGPVQAGDVKKMSFACISKSRGSSSNLGPDTSSGFASKASAAPASTTRSANAGAAKPSAVDSTSSLDQPTTAKANEESAGESTTLHGNAPRPSSIAVSKATTNVLHESAKTESPATTEQPSIIASSHIGGGASTFGNLPASAKDGEENCDSELGNVPAETHHGLLTQAPKPVNGHSHRPHPTNYPWSGKQCSTRTVTRTVYVTSTPTARRS